MRAAEAIYPKNTDSVENRMLYGRVQQYAEIIDHETRLPALAFIVHEIATWPCDCEHPETGETGIIVCLSCRARAALQDAEGSSE